MIIILKGILKSVFTSTRHTNLHQKTVNIYYRKKGLFKDLQTTEVTSA